MGGNTKEGKKRYGDFVLAGITKRMENPIREARAGTIVVTENVIEWIRKSCIDARQWSREEQPQVKSISGNIP